MVLTKNNITRAVSMIVVFGFFIAGLFDVLNLIVIKYTLIAMVGALFVMAIYKLSKS